MATIKVGGLWRRGLEFEFQMSNVNLCGALL